METELAYFAELELNDQFKFTVSDPRRFQIVAIGANDITVQEINTTNVPRRLPRDTSRDSAVRKITNVHHG